MLRKQAVFDRETFLTLPDLPPRLKLWGEDRELEDFLVKNAWLPYFCYGMNIIRVAIFEHCVEFFTFFAHRIRLFFEEIFCFF